MFGNDKGDPSRHESSFTMLQHDGCPSSQGCTAPERMRLVTRRYALGVTHTSSDPRTAGPVMAGPGTAELQLGIHPVNNLPMTLN